MLLSCRKINKSFGDKPVLKELNLDIRSGEKIGLVGQNGAGKTTLAKILAGELRYDTGNIISSRRLNVGYLGQSKAQAEVSLDVLDTNNELQRLASHLGMKRIQDWSGERLQNLSGGEKSKMALASVWTSQPDLLILDEPTNHMDYQGVEYLVSELNSYKGAAIIISHDRYFLDRTVTQIAEIETGNLTLYSGNYSSYRETKLKERENQRHAFESEQKKQKRLNTVIEHLQNWSEQAHRESRQKGEGRKGGKEYFRKKAKKRDQAIKSQIKRLEKLQEKSLDRPIEDPRVQFKLSAGHKAGRRLLEAKDIGKSYGNLRLFKESSFFISRGEKIGILGPNGCGKTTLIKAICGHEDLDSGQIFLSPSSRIACVDQELPENEKASLRDLIKDWPLKQQKNTIQLLIRLGVSYDRLDIALGKLSHGERMKIAVGLATMGQYDCLILDEPTSHLDIYSREALQNCLIEFPGTVLLISHDRYLLQEVCEHLLVFDNQKIRREEDDLANYLSKKDISSKQNIIEDRLLLETRISRVLGELSQRKPGDPDYESLDKEYKELIQKKNEQF